MDRYPLRWPEGWRRTTNQKNGGFGKKVNGSYGLRDLTYHDGVNRVMAELRALKVDPEDVVISTNLKVGLSGMPNAGQREPEDPGVAVYFQKEGQPMRVIAVDAYLKVADNLAGVAATLETMRAIERHGGAQVQEKAFGGFDQLPPPPNCWKILGLDKDVVKGKPTPELRKTLIMDAFRIAAREGHAKGDDMDALVKARDQAVAEVGG